VRQLSHPALPSWPEFSPRKSSAHADPWVERLDQGLKDLWQSEDTSEDDLYHIRKMAHGLED